MLVKSLVEKNDFIKELSGREESYIVIRNNKYTSVINTEQLLSLIESLKEDSYQRYSVEVDTKNYTLSFKVHIEDSGVEHMIMGTLKGVCICQK